MAEEKPICKRCGQQVIEARLIGESVEKRVLLDPLIDLYSIVGVDRASRPMASRVMREENQRLDLLAEHTCIWDHKYPWCEVDEMTPPENVVLDLRGTRKSSPGVTYEYVGVYIEDSEAEFSCYFETRAGRFYVAGCHITEWRVRGPEAEVSNATGV